VSRVNEDMLPKIENVSRGFSAKSGRPFQRKLYSREICFKGHSSVLPRLLPPRSALISSSNLNLVPLNSTVRSKPICLKAEVVTFVVR
jgi:hypothetical protein